MTILECKIQSGTEDDNLDRIISRLEYIQNRHDGGCGLSPREFRTLQLAYQRLELITTPSLFKD